MVKPNRYLFRAFSLVGISLLSLLLVSTTGASAHDLSQYTPVTTDQNQNNNSDNNNNDNNNNDNNNNGGGGYIPGGIPGGGSSNNNNGGGISAGGATAGATSGANASSGIESGSNQTNGSNEQKQPVTNTDSQAGDTSTSSMQSSQGDLPSNQSNNTGNDAIRSAKSNPKNKSRSESMGAYQQVNGRNRSSSKSDNDFVVDNPNPFPEPSHTWKKWYSQRGQTTSKTTKDYEVYAAGMLGDYGPKPGKKVQMIKVTLSRRGRSKKSLLVREIQKVNKKKILYYTVTHYLDYDSADRYELSKIKYYLDIHHKHYVGLSKVIETRRL